MHISAWLRMSPGLSTADSFEEFRHGDA